MCVLSDFSSMISDFKILGSWSFSPILKPGIGGIPIPCFWDYKYYSKLLNDVNNNSGHLMNKVFRARSSYIFLLCIVIVFFAVTVTLYSSVGAYLHFMHEISLPRTPE